MKILVNNQQNGRLETIDVGLTKENTMWFTIKNKGKKMTTNFKGELLISEWGFNFLA